MDSKRLGAMQRNALCRLFGRKEFTPEEVAGLDYTQVERLPKIGKKGIEAIRVWLKDYGYDLSNLPVTPHQCNVKKLKSRLDSAARLLAKHGYRIELPHS